MNNSFERASKDQECLGLLIKIINTLTSPNFDQSKDKILPLPSEFHSILPQKIISRLCDILLLSSKGPDIDSSLTTDPECYIDVITNGAALFVSITTSSPLHLAEFFQQPNVNQWIESTLIYSPIPKGRTAIVMSLFQLCAKDSPVRIEGQSPHIAILSRLLNFLQKIKPNTPTSQQYFILLCNLVDSETEFNFDEIFSFLVQQIKEGHPLIEVFSTV